MRPLIGISAEVAPVTRYWGTDVHHVVDIQYVRAVWAAGGLAVLLPVDEPEAVAALCDRLDGLIITGGNDVDPGFYGEQRLEVGTGGDLEPDRDRFDLALARRAITIGLPTLAICRGLQVLNVACGGSLVQHLADHPETPAEPGANDAVSHPLLVEPDSRLAIRFPELRMVNSYHHQSVARPGDGVRVVATAPDGVVEAIEVDGADQLVAVQWHPEMLPGRAEHAALFSWLIEAASHAPTAASLD